MSFNIAQIKDRARELGKSISDQQAQDIMNASGGGDENYVIQYLKTGVGAPGGPFNFDYAGQAQQAYGELGAYYDRILSDSRGDLNKALARLTEDYNRGIRFKTEDTTQSVASIQKGVESNALSRGLLQKSNFGAGSTTPAQAPYADTGIPQQEYQRSVDPVNQALARYKETSGVDYNRQQTDLPIEQSRREFQLEQERRQQAADLANVRGEQAFTKYQAQQFSPAPF